MNKKTLIITLKAVGISTLYALVVHWFFGVDTWNDLFGVMTVTFLFLLPTILGVLMVYFSDEESVKSKPYRIFFPWIPVFLFLVITIVLSMEGLACWIMILPLFLVTSSIGGVIGGYLKMKKKQNKLRISLLVILPLLLAPLESMVESVPGTYKAYTYIDIDASAEKIWDNVTKVKEISAEEDTGYLTAFLGFPRPLKAELNYEGVGAFRKAVFTNGLVFNETVIAYEDNKKMTFSIEANTFDIPAATLDEHILIGGDYFDVLTGTYELEKIAPERFRLHLYSQFKINTTFNFYAGWWAKWIMRDIQNNILRVEKQRAEEMNSL